MKHVLAAILFAGFITGCALIRMIPGVPCTGIATEEIPGVADTVVQSDCDGNFWFRTVDDSLVVCYTVEQDSLGADVIEIIECPE